MLGLAGIQMLSRFGVGCIEFRVGISKGWSGFEILFCTLQLCLSEFYFSFSFIFSRLWVRVLFSLYFFHFFFSRFPIDELVSVGTILDSVVRYIACARLVVKVLSCLFNYTK